MKNEGAVLVLNDFKKPSVPGSHYRLLCLTGVKKGKSYYLKGDRVIIGRSKEAEVIIEDTLSSREHAELKKMGTTYVITDLSSHNGVLVNDIKIVQHTLKDGDTIVIGKTVFKFNRVVVDDPSDIEISNFQIEGTETKKEVNRGPLFTGILGIVLVLSFLLPSEEPENKRVRVERVKSSSTDIVKRLKQSQKKIDREKTQEVEAAIQKGQRELREKNYFRAIEEFNQAKLLSANNGAASYYLEKTKQALDDEIRDNFIRATRELEALRYQSAIVTYCSIIRLLQNYPEDKRYKDSEKFLRDIEKKLGMLENEIKCF